MLSLHPRILKHKNFIVSVLPLKAKQLNKCHTPSPNQSYYSCSGKTLLVTSILFVKTEMPAVHSNLVKVQKCRYCEHQREEKHADKNHGVSTEIYSTCTMWMWSSRLCLDEVFPVGCAPNGTCRNMWLMYLLQSQQPPFVAQHDLNLDRFIPSHQRQACYSSETVSCILGKSLRCGCVPGVHI